MRAFPKAEGLMEWLDLLVGGRQPFWRRRVTKQFLTCHHASTCEYQRRTGDQPLSALGEGFSGEASIGG